MHVYVIHMYYTRAIEKYYWEGSACLGEMKSFLEANNCQCENANSVPTATFTDKSEDLEAEN